MAGSSRRNRQPGIVFRGVRKLARRSPRIAVSISRLLDNSEDIALLRAKLIETRDGPVEASDALRESQAKTPSVLFRTGYYLERAGNFNEAIAQYDTTLENDPSYIEAIYRKAVCLEKLGDTEQAELVISRFITQDSSDERAHELRWRVIDKAPDWKKAEIACESFNRFPDSLVWARREAFSQRKMKRWEASAHTYQRAYSMSNDADDLALAGLSFLRAGEKLTGLACWESVIRDHGEKFSLGEYIQKCRYWPEAAEAYLLQERHAGEDSVTRAQLLHKAGMAFLRCYEWQQAITTLVEACALSKNDKKCWYHLGFAYERAGLYLEAAVAYRRSIENGTWCDYSLYRLVSVLYKADNIQEALENIPFSKEKNEHESLDDAEMRVAEEMLQRGALRSDSALCFAAADRFIASGDYENASNALSLGLARSEDHKAMRWLDLAYCYAEEGRPEEAIRAFLRTRVFGRPTGVVNSDFMKTKYLKQSCVYLEYCMSLSVRKDVILYESNHGSALTCSIEPLAKRYSAMPEFEKYTHVLVINDRSRIPQWASERTNVIVVGRDSERYLEYLATAGHLINNNTFPPFFSRRSDQKYLNVWHGTPFKSMGKDIRNGQMDHKNAARNFLHVTHFALPNAFTAKVLLDRYDVANLVTAEVAAVGSPRMDRTLAVSPEERSRIREQLGVDLTEKLVLYAPTWRGDLANKRVDIARLEDDIAAMKSSGHTILFRGHPLMEGALKEAALTIHTVPEKLDTNELLAVIDLLVTDYSSIAIDALGAHKPVILYAYDKDEYIKDRGLGLALEELPVTLVEQRESLVDALKLGGVFETDVPSAIEENSLSEIWSHEDGRSIERITSFFFEGDSSFVLEASEYSNNSRGPNVLAFQGHFTPNGITSSAIALDEMLVRAGANVAVAVQPEEIIRPERQEKLAELPDQVGLLGRVGAALRTPEEAAINSQFMFEDYFYSDEQREILHNSYAREFRRLFGWARIDSIVSFEGYSRYWVAVFACATNGARKVQYLHADMEAEARLRFPYLNGAAEFFHLMDILPSVSAAVMEENRVSLSPLGISLEKFAVASNLFNLSAIRGLAREEIDSACRSFIDGNRATLASVGRLSVEKNHIEIIKALENPSLANVGLLLVGDGPERAMLERLAFEAGVSDRIFFAGWQSNPHKYVNNCDIFVLPSLHEGQGIAVLEAYAIGKPVICADISGPADLVRIGGGLLFGDEHASLSTSVSLILEDPPKYAPHFPVDEYLQQSTQQNLLCIFGETFDIDPRFSRCGEEM